LLDSVRIYDVERISQLLFKHLSGMLSEAEHDELMAWVDGHPANQQLWDQLKDETTLDTDISEWMAIPKRRLADDTRLKEAVSKHEQMHKIRRLRRWISYAAAVTVIIGIGIFLFDGSTHKEEQLQVATEILPGGNRATLTFADGRTLDLNEGQEGIVIGDDITYVDGSAVVDNSDEALTEAGLQLSTPKGGTYQITLSDGTNVWLNSSSTLKYPARFSGTERVVEVSGEAYFVVAKDEKRPFIVKNSGQYIQVLGTAFNVSDYEDESEMKTTLVEGAVQILNIQSDRLTRLIPGDQSTVSGGSTRIQRVDVLRFTAWKDGYFYFEHTTFEEVMRQLARWYDVEVVYKNDIPQETFTGEMGRDLTLNAVLKLLSVSAVQVQISEDNKLIVN